MRLLHPILITLAIASPFLMLRWSRWRRKTFLEFLSEISMEDYEKFNKSKLMWSFYGRIRFQDIRSKEMFRKMQRELYLISCGLVALIYAAALTGK